MKDQTLFQGVTSSDLLRALESVGAADASVLFVHSEMSFGKPNAELGKTALLQGVLDVLLELKVPTLVVPTFTFSFCNGVPYNRQQSRSKMGVLNEYIRKLPAATRSVDPLMSCAAIGADLSFVENLSRNSIGEGCTFDKLHAAKTARFLFLGVGAAKCMTYTHYVEEREHVPYRYDRPFAGTIVDGDREYQDTYNLFVRYKGVVPESTTKFEDFVTNTGLMKKVALGDNFVSSISEPDAYASIAGKIHENAAYFLAAPMPAQLEKTFELAAEMVAL